MRMEEQINEGIKNAMKAKDKVRLDTLRGIKKLVIEAKTAGVSREELPDEEVVGIIRKLVKQGTESAGIYRQQHREDLYEYEMGQVGVLKEFLPAQMDDAALTAAVKAIIAETGATSIKEMGKVMGIASKQLAGKADGKAISEKVKELLA